MDGKELSAVHSVGSNRAGQTDSSGHRGGGYRLRQSSERGEAEKVRHQKLAAIQYLSAFDEETNHSLLRIHDGGFTAGIDQGTRETKSGGASWQTLLRMRSHSDHGCGAITPATNGYRGT
jgi:hypothetical protein